MSGALRGRARGQTAERYKEEAPLGSYELRDVQWIRVEDPVLTAESQLVRPVARASRSVR